MDKNSIEKIYQIVKNNLKISTDSRSIKKGDVFFALSGDNFNGNKFIQIALESGASLVIGDDPNYKTKNSILVKDALSCLQELAKYHRSKLNIPVIGLTGSNGKTTTKELLQAVLKKKYSTSATLGNFNNHIGVPLTLLNIKSSHEIAIVEMGANHVGEISMLSNLTAPNYGLITNIGIAHLEGFGSQEGILKGKTELYNHIKNHNGIVFVNGDDELLMGRSQGISKIIYGNNPMSEVKFIRPKKEKEYCSVTLIFGNKSFDVNSKLIGDYNIPNIVAAAAIGYHFDIKPTDICAAIEAYKPSNKRSQLIQTQKTNKIYLDAYNANPSSMRLAIENFVTKSSDQDKFLILGDMLEMGDFQDIEHEKILKQIKNSNLKNVFLVGECFDAFESKYPEFLFYLNVDDLIEDLKSQKLTEKHLLIKGSRGIKLEKVLEEL